MTLVCIMLVFDAIYAWVSLPPNTFSVGCVDSKY